MKSPTFDGGLGKEYHVWNRLGSEASRKNNAELESKDHLQIQRQNKTQKDRMRTDRGYYFDYFSSLYSGAVSVLADITPLYSGLDETCLGVVAREFCRRGVDVKPVILVREPLNRVKSAVRFNLDRKNYSEGIVDGEKEFKDALEQYYSNEDCHRRTNYYQIIDNTIRVFGENEVFIGVLENMFTPVEIERLSRFLGVDAYPEFGAVRINKNKKAVEETDIDGEIKEYYSRVYEYCYEKLPVTRDLWA